MNAIHISLQIDNNTRKAPPPYLENFGFFFTRVFCTRFLRSFNTTKKTSLEKSAKVFVENDCWQMIGFKKFKSYLMLIHIIYLYRPKIIPFSV